VEPRTLGQRKKLLGHKLAQVTGHPVLFDILRKCEDEKKKKINQAKRKKVDSITV
jgi:hypothetical protein